MRAFWAVLAVAAITVVVGAGPIGAASSTVPTVTSFTPKLGAVGASVSIVGTKFVNGATTVDFNGTVADSVNVAGTTKLTVAVPDGATTGKIGVTTAGGTGHSSTDFTVAARPTVDSFLPTSGKVGATVTITGTSFTGATAVYFDGTKATSWRVGSDTTIKATVPKGAQDGSIAVDIPGAEGVSADDFDVLLPPSISSFTPNYGAVGDPITVDGANFTNDVVVKFGTKAADVTDVSAGELTATVPAGIAKTGKLTVSNSIGSSTSVGTFTLQTAPKVTSFSPASGHSGTTVTLAGSGFLGATAVTFAGTSAWSFSVISDSKMTAVVGPNATAGAIAVTSGAGTGTTTKQFAGTSFIFRDEMAGELDATDPALAYDTQSWQMEYATCLPLLQYADASGQPGTLLQPEGAAAFPDVSDDGLTYTFTVADNMAFPDGEAVTAASYKHAIERSVDPAMNGSAGSFMKDIAGEADYVSGSADSISGIVAEGQTLTITLTNNDPDFLARLAMPFFCAVPTGEPDTADATIASAGPYTIDSIDGATITLDRNPHYGGTRPAYPDQILIKQDIAGASLYPDVLKGANGDYTNSLSGTDLAAAIKNAKQTALIPQDGFRYFALNTSRDLFGNADARKAFNLILNRKSIAAAVGVTNTPTDQYLPPNMPGYTDANIYPLAGPTAGQLAQARTLAISGGLTNAVIEYWTCDSAVCTAITSLVQSELQQLKLNITLHVTTYHGYQLYSHAGMLGAAFDIVGPLGWVADYPDPFDILNILLDGTSIGPSNNLDLSYFDDGAYNGDLEAAALLTGDDRYSTYGTLDTDLAQNAAPLAAISTLTQYDFFAPKIGCRIVQPTYGTDFGALCSS